MRLPRVALRRLRRLHRDPRPRAGARRYRRRPGSPARPAWSKRTGSCSRPPRIRSRRSARSPRPTIPRSRPGSSPRWSPAPRPACWPTTSSMWRTSPSSTPGPSGPMKRPRSRSTPWPATTGPSPCPTSIRSPTGRTRAWRRASGRWCRPAGLSYRLSAPFHLRLRIDFVEAGGTNVIGFFIQPETADSCRLFTTLWRDDLSGDRGADGRGRGLRGGGACARTCGSKSRSTSWSCPWSRTAEVHTRADRTTLELRRVLSDLVTTVEG